MKMKVLNTNCFLRIKYSHLPNLHLSFGFVGRDKDKCHKFSSNSNYSFKSIGKVFAGQNQARKLRRREKLLKKDRNLLPVEQLPVENDGVEISSSGDIIAKEDVEISKLEFQTSVIVPSSRGSVLQACTITSGLIGGVGVLLREVSHVASREGWPILDCSASVNFHFEFWHFELIAGSVMLVSTCRFFLLKTWSNFAESSEAASQQILTSLEPLDYLIVAFLPGISEEILFRGALLPLFGINWFSILAVAGVFGILHLGSGRKYSFAIWATFVGLVYGYATVLSSSAIVPMASHALNNLIGGIIWRYTSKSSKKIA